MAVAVCCCTSNAEATETACARSVADDAIGGASVGLEEVIEARGASSRGCNRRVDRCACMRREITCEVVALWLRSLGWLTVRIGLARVADTLHFALFAVGRPFRFGEPTRRGWMTIGAPLLARPEHPARAHSRPRAARHGRMNLRPHDAICAPEAAKAIVVAGRIERVGWA